MNASMTYLRQFLGGFRCVCGWEEGGRETEGCCGGEGLTRHTGHQKYLGHWSRTGRQVIPMACTAPCSAVHGTTQQSVELAARPPRPRAAGLRAAAVPDPPLTT